MRWRFCRDCATAPEGQDMADRSAARKLSRREELGVESRRKIVDAAVDLFGPEAEQPAEESADAADIDAPAADPLEEFRTALREKEGDWFVVHSYAGYENKVKTNLEHRIESMGIEEFRTGGTSGGIKLLIGEWGELGEQKLPFELLVCPSCRYTEFRAAW